MKKLACLVLAALLAVAGTALAEYTPSKTTSDLANVSIEGENIPEDADFHIDIVAANDEEYRELVQYCNSEIEKLASSESIETYFGQVVDLEGSPVSLKALLGTETLNVFEFCPLIASGYQNAYGPVTLTMLFSTPYEKDETVVVLFGVTVIGEDGAKYIHWIAVEGSGLGNVDGSVEMDGAIRIELSPDLIKAIENGNVLMAVVSK